MASYVIFPSRSGLIEENYKPEDQNDKTENKKQQDNGVKPRD